MHRPLHEVDAHSLLNAAVELDDGDALHLVRVEYREGALCIDDGTNAPIRRPWAEADGSALTELAREYAQAVKLNADLQTFEELGRRLTAWLDGESSWWSTLLRKTPTALGLEVVLPEATDDTAQALHQAPWEILAGPMGCAALDPRIRLSVWRRLGPPTPSPPPREALSVLFMAAAPEGSTALDYEQEETAVLSATEGLPLELFVEETGTAMELGVRLGQLGTQAPVRVVHLSCHGTIVHDKDEPPRPVLTLEDEVGGEHLVDAEMLLEHTGPAIKNLGLLFLSACLTAQGDEVDSLTHALVDEGIPAALGWAGSVYDGEASAFTAALYTRLAGGYALPRAVAVARRVLIQQWQRSGGHSHHWHLARLLLGSSSGAPLAALGATPRPRPVPPAQFLDAGRQVPIAGPEQFVGRRRPLQTVVRTLREGSSCGVLLHGVGRQGKSSLAARVVQRMRTHTPVVMHSTWTAAQLLDALASTMPERVTVPDCPDADGLEAALRSILDPEDGPPLLLVLDDLEQLLEPSAGGAHRVRAPYHDGLRAVLRAFRFANRTKSGLLMTSRYRFVLDDEGGEPLHESLLALGLPSMASHEVTKQAR
ncbi:MAG: CHAT domain-containing protein, partial [Myxococcota bacterium]